MQKVGSVRNCQNVQLRPPHSTDILMSHMVTTTGCGSRITPSMRLTLVGISQRLTRPRLVCTELYSNHRRVSPDRNIEVTCNCG